MRNLRVPSDNLHLNFYAHLLYGDGALADRVEGLRVVVILKVGRVVVGLGAAVILKIFVGQ